MSTTRTIGKLGEDTDKKGTLYSLTYFVLNADKATYTPVINQDGDAAPFGFPADTYIYNWKITGVSDHWLIVVKACNDDYDWGDSGSNFTKTSTTTKRSFGVTDMFFPMEWFGIIRLKDHPNYSKWKASQNEGSDKWGNVKKALEITVDADKPGDLIYANASWDANGAKVSSGSFVASQEAKQKWNNHSTKLEGYRWLAGQKAQTVTYTCVMYRSTSKAIETYLNWSGVNGSFSGSGGGGDCTPAGHTDGGTWKSTSQTISEDSETFNGVAYNTVTRVMERAYHDLRFRPSLTSAPTLNGPVWTW